MQSPLSRHAQRLAGWAIMVAVIGALAPAHADSVAQVSTAKRISRQTVTLIDPQGRPGAGVGTDTAIKVGDILTFVIQFTPVENGASRGLGGYVTDYIPQNTAVVGARIIDRNGNTVSPHRGGLSCDGFGPRGSNWATSPLLNGSMSQLYADTGIFYSTDLRTERRPTGAVAGQAFLTLKNGLQIPQSPSGAGQFDSLLGTSAPYFAHNEWDLAQVVVYGPGNGNTPEHVANAGLGYGSPVAGPQGWYQLENTVTPANAAITQANSLFSGNVGPWKRIRTTGSEIGKRGQGDYPRTATFTMPQCAGSAPTRVGVPAKDMTGTLIGHDLSPDNPLPVGTNAVRFALGELVVGDEYYAEISLRVKALPLDPVSMMDINCAEVMGGDASSRAQNGGTGGKDHLWRYFLPAPSCVLLNLLFENTVDKVLTLANSSLTRTLEVKNLSTVAQTGVVVRDCYDPGVETFVAAGTTPGYTLDATGAGCPFPASEDAIYWNVGTLMPGESRTYTIKFTAKSSGSNHAVYTSTALPAPGFVATAYTTVGALAVMRLDLQAAPAYVATLPGVTRYTARLTNVGTGTPTTTEIDITLPAGFSYKNNTTRVNGVGVAQNPTIVGQTLRFLVPPLPASIAPGVTVTLEFDADIAGGTPAGLYTANMNSWVRLGQDLEDAIAQVAPVAVVTQRSDVPTVTSPILAGATTVSGTTGEGPGATVRVYVNGNPAGSATSAGGGAFSVTVPTLFAGQRVTVTVQAAGELEGLPSSPVVVTGVTGTAACSDGKDNDGDGKCDSGGCTIAMVALPADPGCTSAADADETDVPQCADGVDNNGTGGTDFPNDPGCSSLIDNTEAGGPACSDGVDNDNDGKMDFPNDPGCATASDVNEDDVPACADALDNDGDGKVDFPADPGCASSIDNDENDFTGPQADMSAAVDLAGADDGMSAGNVRPDGAPPDPGGVGDGGRGCGCTIGAAPRRNEGLAPLLWVCALGLVAFARTRRRAATRPPSRET